MNTNVNAAPIAATSIVAKPLTKQRITLTEREDALLSKLAKLMKLSKAQLLTRACGSIGLQPHVSEGISPIISLEGLPMHEWGKALADFEKKGLEKRDFLTFTMIDYVNEKL